MKAIIIILIQLQCTYNFPISFVIHPEKQTFSNDCTGVHERVCGITRLIPTENMRHEYKSRIGFT